MGAPLFTSLPRVAVSDSSGEFVEACGGGQGVWHRRASVGGTEAGPRPLAACPLRLGQLGQLGRPSYSHGSTAYRGADCGESGLATAIL